MGKYGMLVIFHGRMPTVNDNKRCPTMELQGGIAAALCSLPAWPFLFLVTPEM